MVKTLNMKFMRYINLFEKISRVRPKHCFEYCNNIIFIVDKAKVSKAIGEEGKNVKKISEIMGKKVKVVAKPENNADIEDFILDIIHPAKFKSIEIKSNEIIVNAGSQSKAMLIGRNKSRLNEMQNIIKQYFNKSFKVI